MIASLLIFFYTFLVPQPLRGKTSWGKKEPSFPTQNFLKHLIFNLTKISIPSRHTFCSISYELSTLKMKSYLVGMFYVSVQPGITKLNTLEKLEQRRERQTLKVPFQSFGVKKPLCKSNGALQLNFLI